MNGREEVLEDLKKSVETWSPPLEDSLDVAISIGLTPGKIVNDRLSEGTKVVRDRFDNADIYLPQVLAVSRVMERTLSILEPLILRGKKVCKGTVVMGTVQGDIHEIGKNVCCATLRGAGYNVICLGSDVKPRAFVEVAKDSSANILGFSALMTITLIIQGVVLKAICEEKIPRLHCLWWRFV